MTTSLAQAFIDNLSNPDKASKILALIRKYEPETLLSLTDDDKSLLYIALKNNASALASELIPLYLTKETLFIPAGPENKNLLHALAEFGNIDILKKILSQLIDCNPENINAVTDSGDTALHLALDPLAKNYNRVQTVAILINAGARWDLHNNQNEIASDNLFKLPAELQLTIFIKLEKDKQFALLKSYRNGILNQTFNDLNLYYKLCEKHSLEMYLITIHEFNSNVLLAKDNLISDDLLAKMPLYADKINATKTQLMADLSDTNHTLIDNLDKDRVTLFKYKQQFTHLLDSWHRKASAPSRQLSVYATMLSCLGFSAVEVPLIYFSTQENEDDGPIYTAAFTFGLMSIFAEVFFTGAFTLGFFHEKRFIFSNEWKAVVENFKNEVLVYLQQLDNQQKERNPSHVKSINLLNVENDFNELAKYYSIREVIRIAKNIVIHLGDLQKELTHQKISFSAQQRVVAKKLESIIDIQEENEIELTPLELRM